MLDRIPTRPEEIWVSDITYAGTRNKHTYLALVTDAYSKKIVGYDLSDSLSAEGAIRALQMACRGRMYKKQPLCDLGTQQRIVAQSVAIYNELRPHLSCGMLTPDEMHRQCKKEIATYRTKNDNTALCVVI